MKIVVLALIAALVAAACANPDLTSASDPDSPVPTGSIERPASSTAATSEDDQPLSDSQSLQAFRAAGGRVDLSGMIGGLEACSALDVETYSRLLEQSIVHNIEYDLATVEPSAFDRSCALFAAEDPSVELLRINVTNRPDRWVDWNIRNSDRSALAIPRATVATHGSGGESYATLELEDDDARIVVEARNWKTGIIFEPAPLLSLLSIAEAAAHDLTSSSAPGTNSILGDCDELDPFKFAEFVEGELNGFSTSTYDRGLACTAEATSGDRVQVIAREYPTTALAGDAVADLAAAYEVSSRSPAALISNRANRAWSIDRVYDDDPNGSNQTTLVEAFGYRDTTVFRVSLRVDTSQRHIFNKSLTTIIDAILSGDWPDPVDVGDESTTDLDGLDASVAEFLEAGGNIEVAPLVRGLGRCDELDPEPFEVITGAELLIVDLIADSKESSTVVECALVRVEDPNLTEMIVRASSTPDGTTNWTDDLDLDELSPLEGIVDRAFWNGSDDEWIQLYIEEFDARLLVELANHSYTDEVNVFWVANAFARDLLAS